MFRAAPRVRGIQLVARSGPGGALVLAMVAFAIVAPLVVPHDPVRQDLASALAAPSLWHPLGFDHLGRDVAARVAHGAARSIGLAVLCVAGAFATGTALGLIAATSGRFPAAAIMRLADLMLAFPGILLALLFAGFFGGGIVPMLVGVKLTLWPQFARMTHSIATGQLLAPHVEAARLAGFPETTVLLRHVFPTVLRQTLPLATLGIGTAVMSISSLGFLGLGLQPPIPEWGAMISEILPYLSEAPVQMAAPCVALVLTVLGFTLGGRALTNPAATRE